MRIYKNEGQWNFRFSLPWEQQRLSELGDSWVPFSLPGDSYACGRLHAQSREIIFFQATELQDNQLIVLEFPEDEQDATPGPLVLAEQASIGTAADN